jgi:hypothetical protein
VPVPLTLKHLFSSRLRVQVPSHFLFHPGEAFHVRRLAGELEQSAGSVARVERHLKRRINYTHYTRAEAQKRLGKQVDFVHEVLAGPKIVLIGNTDDRLFGVA